MNLVSVIGSVATVLSMVAFAGVVWWALGRTRRERFEVDAQAPFALPDDLVAARSDGEASP